MRTLLAICAFALPIPAVIAGCGDDDDNSGSDVDPQEVLEATFSNESSITSGDLDLSVSVSAEGDEGVSFEAGLGGPFQGDPDNPNTLPQLDWTVNASGEGGDQDLDFEGGAVVTEDNAYVEYGGEAYEVGSEDFLAAKKQLESQAGGADEDVGFAEAFQQGCEQSVRQQGGDPSTCDFDVSAWLTDQSSEGTEDVEGEETNHVSGELNIEQALNDIGGIAAGFPGAEQAGFDLNQLGQLSAAVEEASFDVYSGVEDDLLRKLEFNLAIDPSAIAAGAAVPVESIDVGFSLTLSGVNETQTIEAPSDARPISELSDQLNLGDLGLQLPGLDSSGLGGGLEDLGGGGGAGGGDADAAQRYLDCISQAQTAEDQAACASEL
jgi:hypothetical protein